MLLHGGYWAAAYGRWLMDDVADDLLARGWASCNVGYRRIGSGGGAPGTFDDLVAALEALWHAPGAATLDPSRVVALGHSAGGHLALWLAGTRRVTAAVSLGGVCNVAGAARRGLGGGAAVAFLGGTPDERPDAYAAADLAARLPTGIPQLLLHGADDDVVPIDQMWWYADRCEEAGEECTALALPGTGHFEFLDPWTPAWGVVADALGRWGPAAGTGVAP